MPPCTKTSGIEKAKRSSSLVTSWIYIVSLLPLWVLLGMRTSHQAPRRMPMNTTETMAPRCHACKDHLAPENAKKLTSWWLVTYECYGSWAGDQMPEISGCLCSSAHGMLCYTIRMLMLCVGGDVFSRCSGIAVWVVSEKASHAPKMQPRCSSATWLQWQFIPQISRIWISRASWPLSNVFPIKQSQQSKRVL